MKKMHRQEGRDRQKERSGMKKYSGIQGFPERLDRAIKESGKTFGQVCRETGISRTTLYELKRGNQGPLAVHVAKLSVSLQCSTDWLLGVKNNFSDVPFTEH